MIELPTSTVSDITGIISGLFTDFSSLIILIIGIILGVYLIEKITGLLREKNPNPDK